mmetsp:Transcript_138350/g.275804  ORF Transcript_138350/g.275804 Transcript_138350/m.275804 type:complete len:113 (+) Transcript_138350:574-912(+)
MSNPTAPASPTTAWNTNTRAYALPPRVHPWAIEAMQSSQCKLYLLEKVSDFDQEVHNTQVETGNVHGGQWYRTKPVQEVIFYLIFDPRCNMQYMGTVGDATSLQESPICNVD